GGTGELVLTGANTYTGGTDVTGGVLTAGANNVIPDNSTVTTGAGATFNLAGFEETIGGLAGTAGGVVLGDGTTGDGWLTVGASNKSSVFGGVMSGAGRLFKTGTGTLTLTGANTFADT